jgi:hypothetical protein
MSRTPSYHHNIVFTNQTDTLEHIKWCRRNLGERGVDWDFSGYTNLLVVIFNPKYVPFYKLKFD